MPVSNDDLAEAIQRLDETLSEVLVLLFHVIHAHEDAVESLRAERLVVAASRVAERRPRTV